MFDFVKQGITRKVFLMSCGLVCRVFPGMSAQADVTLAGKKLSQRFKLRAIYCMHALRAYVVPPEGHSNLGKHYDVMAMVAIQGAEH